MQTSGELSGTWRLALAFAPLMPPALFRTADWRRLEAFCSIPDAMPLRAFNDARASALLAEAQILVTGWGCPRIDAAVLEAAPRLRLIAHAAGSVKALVGPEAFDRGITVVSAADANALPVAEFTVGAILFANKRVFDLAAAYRRERRGLNLYLSAPAAIGNFGKVIGLIGASRIGRRVAELLRPYDFELLLADPLVSAEDARALGAEKLELDELLARSDVVSVHAPSLPETRHMLDARRLGLMRDGTILINTARGALIDQAALIAELVSGRLSAVLDVTEPDILPAESPLYDLPNVLLTPHIAGAMGEERQRFGRLVTDEIERFIRGEALRHAIDPATFQYQA